MSSKLIKYLKISEVVKYIKYKRENSTFSQGLDYQNGYLDALENLEMDIAEGVLASYLADENKEDVIL